MILPNLIRNVAACTVMSLALLAPATTLADHEVSVTSVTPGGVHTQPLGGASGVICDPAVGVISLFDCTPAGGALGGSTFDVSGHGRTWWGGNTWKSNWSGDCSVRKMGPTAGFPGSISVLCAVDRDDDAVYTNMDTSGSFVASTGQADCVPPVGFGPEDHNDNDRTAIGDCDHDHKSPTQHDYDDMGWTDTVPDSPGSGEGIALPVCFAHDAAEPGFGDHDWDDFAVFTSAYISIDPLPAAPGGLPYVGFVDISFSRGMTTYTDCFEDTFEGAPVAQVAT